MGSRKKKPGTRSRKPAGSPGKREAMRLAGVEASLRKMLSGNPQDGIRWGALGNALDAQGKKKDAEDAWREALKWSPEHGEAHNNLATVLLKRGECGQAVKHLERALALKAEDPLIMSNLGAAYRTALEFEKAVAVLRRAIEIDPHLHNAHTNLGLCLSSQGATEEALVHLERAVELCPTYEIAHNNLLLNLHYSQTATPERIAAAHRRYGDMMGSTWPVTASSGTDTNPARPLRVGLVSADFRQHPVSFFVAPLLANRDPGDLTVIAYCNASRQDEITARLRGLTDGWRSIYSLSDDEVVALVRSDEIDILMDLGGHTAGNRLGVFARRGAPVQITYLGYPDTTGLRTMDYRLTDPWAEPPGDAGSLYSEKLLEMGEGFLVYDPPAHCPAIATEAGAEALPITFGSFNALKKISTQTLRMWGQIMARATGSRLLLKNSELSDGVTRLRMEDRMRELDFDMTRVELLGRLPDYYSHMEVYRRVDVALDTYPYHGTTTTFDALWMGVPTVTLAGPTHASRVGVSILTRADLGDLVASTPQQFVDLAVQLGEDRARRATLRTTMRNRMRERGLVDGPRVAGSFTDALRKAWREHLGQTPVAEPPKEDAVTRGRKIPLEDTVWQTIPGQIHIATPGSLQQMTRYVIEEQADWFEDEIAFFRTLLKKGEHALDVGANHGVYSLTIARSVGPDGHVYAFEPAGKTAARLRASALANGFDHLQVIQAAVSDKTGEAVFHTGTSSELSSLSAFNGGNVCTEKVRVTTIDACAREGDWRDISVLKLDVEGEEVRALEGARELLRDHEPLLMVEHKHGEIVNTEIYDWLKATGHDIYRLVPGIGILIPHPPGTEDDAYLLNTFAAREPRAQRLESMGLLARNLSEENQVPPVLDWRETVGWIPAVAQVGGSRFFGEVDEGQARHRLAIERYGLAMNRNIPPPVRARCLKTALDLACLCIQSSQDVGRLMTLARLAVAWGRRMIAVEALQTAIFLIGQGQGKIAEPFLPPNSRFDTIDPGADLANWALGALYETLEKNRAFSSYFTYSQPSTIQNLELIEQLGFQGPEMGRRLDLVKKMAQQTASQIAP